MRRRDLLRRAGSAGLIAVGAAGVTSAHEREHVAWTFEDGHREVMTRAEFERRPDTPDYAEIEDVGTYDHGYQCCSCPDVEGSCVPCFELICH